VNTYFEVPPRQLAQHRRVQVGRDHRSIGRHPIAQPSGDRAAASADFEAPPAEADPQRIELLHGSRIEHRLKRSEPLALHRADVLKGVCRLISGRHTEPSPRLA